MCLSRRRLTINDRMDDVTKSSMEVPNTTALFVWAVCYIYTKKVLHNRESAPRRYFVLVLNGRRARLALTQVQQKSIWATRIGTPYHSRGTTKTISRIETESSKRGLVIIGWVDVKIGSPATVSVGLTSTGSEGDVYVSREKDLHLYFRNTV